MRLVSAAVRARGGGLGIGTGEGIRLDFVNDLTGNPAGGDFPANSDFVFSDHYDANGAAVTIGGINAGSAAARFTAKDDSDVGGNDFVNDGAVDPITSIAIRFGGETKIVSSWQHPLLIPSLSAVTPLRLRQDGASVIVDGLVNGATIATYTATGFNSLEVTYVSGNPFTITGFGTSSGP